jgi:hypothetical protein
VALEPGTAAFLQGKGAEIVGIVHESGWPLATRAWGITVLSAAEGRLRVMLDEEEAPAFTHLVGGGTIAITSADVPTLRSCQVKGRVERLAPVTEADLAVVDEHCHAVFTDISVVDRIPYDLIARIKPDHFVACELVVDEVYDQTPGPGAGATVAEFPP